MRSSIITLVGALAFAASQSTADLPVISAAPGSLSLGDDCSTSDQCPTGVECHTENQSNGVANPITTRTCGSYQAACSSDSQCATNTCINGICNGYLGGLTNTASVTPTIPAPTLPTVTAAAGSLSLGDTCSETSQCPDKVDCYGTTAFTIKTCGSFNSGCETDAQCATNTCQNGICSGFLQLTTTLSTSTTSKPSTTPTIPSPTLPTVTAAAGSLSLGDTCSETSQCPANVDCYGTTAFTIKTCGSFNSSCDTDAQCATNTCQNGICSGFLQSSAAGTSASTTATSTLKTALSVGTGVSNVAASGTGVSSPEFTGGASMVGAGSGLFGVALAVALVL